MPDTAEILETYAKHQSGDETFRSMRVRFTFDSVHQEVEIYKDTDFVKNLMEHVLMGGGSGREVKEIETRPITVEQNVVTPDDDDEMVEEINRVLSAIRDHLYEKHANPPKQARHGKKHIGTEVKIPSKRDRVVISIEEKSKHE